MASIELLFETSKFNLSEQQEHFINPCCFGEDLAEWLCEQLKQKGLQPNSPAQEDWGWYTEVVSANATYSINISGNAENENVPSNLGEWRLSVEKHRTFLEKLRGKQEIERDAPLIRMLIEILEGEQEFSKVRVESSKR